MTLIEVFFIFFKIGLFSLGGGLATLPFLQDACAKYGWMNSSQLADMIAISESTPGPIGINMATFIGFKIFGILGGIIATLGLVAPSLIIIILIAHYFMKFNEKPIVKAGFYGLRPAVTGLIAAAGFEVAKIALFNVDKFQKTNKILDIFNIKALLLFAVIVFLINKFRKHPIVYIVGAAVVGIIFKY